MKSQKLMFIKFRKLKNINTRSVYLFFSISCCLLRYILTIIE